MTYVPWKTLGLAVVIAGGAQIAAVSGASALTLPMTNAPQQVQHQDGDIVKVASKKHRRHYRSWNEYRRHHGGHRYRHRRAGYTYYYGGYYYPSPWWTLSVPLPIVPVPGVSIHIGG